MIAQATRFYDSFTPQYWQRGLEACQSDKRQARRLTHCIICIALCTGTSRPDVWLTRETWGWRRVTAGRLFGVSVGPGDPELVTLKALRVLREADVIAYPCTGHGASTALEIVAEHVTGKPPLECLMPMTRDRGQLARAHARAADDICARLSKGLDVAYLCLGDVSVYASFGYLRDEVRARGFKTEAVPGVTSFCAAAARLELPLCEDEGRLVIASAQDEHLDEVLDLPATKVLMKPGRSLQPLRAALENHYMLDKAHTVTRCGYGDEQVHDGVPTDASGYFSLVIVDE